MLIQKWLVLKFTFFQVWQHLMMVDISDATETGTLTSFPGCPTGSHCCYSTSPSATCSTAPLGSRPSSPSSSTGSSSEQAAFKISFEFLFSVDLVPSAPSQLDWGIWSPMLTFSQWQVFHKFTLQTGMIKTITRHGSYMNVIWATICNLRQP